MMFACPGYILKRTKGIEIKLGLWIDGSERKCSAQEQASCVTGTATLRQGICAYACVFMGYV